MPAGPDYWLSLKPHSLEAVFKDFHDDENLDKAKIGLEISFSSTPKNFNSPESLKEFILDQFSLYGLRLRENGGVPEIYEVVGGRPQS